MKNILLPIILLIPLFTYAQNNSDFKINAEITSGCRISLPLVDFGIVSKDTAWLDAKNRIVKKMSIFCSKGTSFVITGDLARAGEINSIANISKTEYAHPLFSTSSENTDYLGFLVIAPLCGTESNPTSNQFSNGKVPMTGISEGKVIEKDVCFSLKGMKGFPGYGVRPGTYSGYYTFTISY